MTASPVYPDSTPGLTYHRVSVELGGREVVREVAFSAAHGEVTALLGPNGAGKTTCLKAALGLVAVRGEVTLDGENVLAISDRERAQRVAYVPQRSRLTAALPVRRVIGQGRFAHRGALAGPTAADRRAIDEAMATTRIEALAERRFTELSGGEQQRVLLARALATGARTILLDEPTSSLDVGHSLTMLGTLRHLAQQGCCVVTVLHDLNEARTWADTAVLLDRGAVVASGPVDRIIAPRPIRHVYEVEIIEGGAMGFSSVGPAEAS
ncbi:MAG: ABC transporter ATP-binding protein [Myxococcota bacterium]